MVQHKIRSSQKTALIDFDRTQLDKWTQELEDLQRKRYHRERALYEAESMLPTQPLKDNYNCRRKDPKWYMQEELDQDCIDQGGCCSRSCGCCDHRSGTGNRTGIGHCTVECWCCLSSRDFELSEQEKTEVRNSLNSRLRSDNPAFLIRMANVYFSKVYPIPPKLEIKPSSPEPEIEPKPTKTWWQRTFGKASARSEN